MFEGWVNIPWGQWLFIYGICVVIHTVLVWLLSRIWPQRAVGEGEMEFGFVGSDHEEA